MNPQELFCPNIECPARGQQGKGNVGVHSEQEQRYICHECDQTFSARKGTLFYRLRTDATTVLLVIALMAYGCPMQAIVKAFGFDERTVKNWWQRAGEHCQAVHEHVVEQSQLDLQQVQADELKVKMQGKSVWMAMAMMVPTRLWLGGVISPTRDKVLIEQLVAKVRSIARCRPLLLAVDGLVSYVSVPFRRLFARLCRAGATPVAVSSWPGQTSPLSRWSSDVALPSWTSCGALCRVVKSWFSTWSSSLKAAAPSTLHTLNA